MHALIVFCAQYLIVLPVLVVAFVEFIAVRRSRYDMVIVGVLVSIFGLLLAKLGAQMIHDARPFVSDGTAALVSSAHDNGFPSDHTLLASLMAVIGWHADRRLGAGLAVVAGLVGWGRVAAHVHHLPDIIGAMIVAVLSYVLARICLRLYYLHSPRRT